MKYLKYLIIGLCVDIMFIFTSLIFGAPVNLRFVLGTTFICVCMSSIIWFAVEVN